jgi:hypothetical protein
VITTTIETVATSAGVPDRADARPTVLAVLHPKGGVGRSTTVWHLGAELILRGLAVRIEDLDQAKHLSNVAYRRGLLMPGLTIAEAGPADVVLLCTVSPTSAPTTHRRYATGRLDDQIPGRAVGRSRM